METADSLPSRDITSKLVFPLYRTCKFTRNLQIFDYGCNPIHTSLGVSPIEHNEIYFWVDMPWVVLGKKVQVVMLGSKPINQNRPLLNDAMLSRVQHCKRKCWRNWWDFLPWLRKPKAANKLKTTKHKLCSIEPGPVQRPECGRILVTATAGFPSVA